MQPMFLDNGLTVEFIDSTRRYYGNFYHVRIVVCCSVSLTPELAAHPEQHEQLRTLLGTEVRYERTLEQMGVAGGDVDEVQARLVAHFVETAVPYLSSPSFPRQFVASRMAQLQKQGRFRP